MEIFKISSLNLISLGFWITPNGQVINLGGCCHTSYISKNYDKFGLTREEVIDYSQDQSHDLCKLAFDKEAIRISILKALAHNFFAIQGNFGAIKRKYDIIERLYKEFAPSGAKIIIEDADSKRFQQFNQIDELFEYASNKKMIKIAENYANGWIMPDGEIILLGLQLHSDYVLYNIDKFGVSKELVDLYESDLYRIAFKFGAIRFSVYKNEFSIQCTKEALSKNIEVVHRLYKRYICGSGDIYLDLVSLDSDKISPKHGKKITLEDLFKYASINNWYKTSMKKGMSRAEKQKIEFFVDKIKKGYHNWGSEDIQLYQNNAQIIEKLLRDEKVEWNLMDELDDELEDLKRILRL